jgi:hypothetical protein
MCYIKKTYNLEHSTYNILRSKQMHIPRPRGGQPGNQNARKHGFYSSVFTRQDRASLKQASAISGLDEEIALLRARLRSVMKNDPDNLRLISEASSTLARLIRTNQKLGLNAPDKLEQARWNVIYDSLSQMGFSTQHIVDMYLGKIQIGRPENRDIPGLFDNSCTSK